MKKALKVVGVVAVAGAGLYACNYYKQYRKFKKMEERMEKLPLHKLQEAVKEKRSNPIQLLWKYPRGQGYGRN